MTEVDRVKLAQLAAILAEAVGRETGKGEQWNTSEIDGVIRGALAEAWRYGRDSVDRTPVTWIDIPPEAMGEDD